MANSFTPSFKEVWAKKQQEVFYKLNIARQIADTSEEGALSSGDTLNRTYRSGAGTPKVYTRGTDMVARDLTDTGEQLVINKEFYDYFYVDNHDKIQNDYNAALGYGKDGGEALANIVDANVLGEVANATSVVDAGTIGGTSGQGIALDTTNVVKTVTAVTEKLRTLNVMGSDKYAVITPAFENIMVQYGVARATSMGDDLNRNPDFLRWMGYDFYVSNQVACSAVLAMATNPTASDTVTIAGVVFTFVSSIGSTAGNVLIGGSADATRANLEALIHDPKTTTATGVALSTANADYFAAFVASVNDDTANTLTVTVKGAGSLTVSETLTAGGDVWTTTLQKKNLLFGVRGNPYLVMQQKPSISFVEAQARNGYFYKNTILFGTKTFADNAKQMVRVEIL